MGREHARVAGITKHYPQPRGVVGRSAAIRQTRPVTPTVRAYRSDDLAAIYDVCVRTADRGDDLTGALADPMLPGHLYAGPYGVLEPKSAFVAEDEEGVGGYIIGAADTAAFERRLELEWFPELRAKYPEGAGAGDMDNVFISMIHHPVIRDSAIAEDYPAHLHIDILPRLQGQGLGRRLIELFCDEMQRRGVTGVHFGVNPRNDRALGFYRHIAFDELSNDGTSVLLGRRFA